MNFFDALILGVLEGFTEFLPVSSTAHLVLASHALAIVPTEFTKSFIIIIQFGTITSVVALYCKKFLTDWETNKRIAVAFLPTALIGFALYQLIKGVLLESIGLIIGVLIAGGVALILLEWLFAGRKESARVGTDGREQKTSDIPYWKAFAVGCAQALAIVPGVSRSAATIMGGMLLGLPRTTIVEFSFLLAVPTMAAAAGYDLLKSAHAFSFAQWDVLAFGFIVAFAAGIAGVKFLLAVVKSHTFIGFGVYRILAGLLFFFLIF
ncbi:MAG: undecaprenyl-diphosphate phosphatase [Patescibacteria group bacterium]|mgnify:CR=1 FL=1